MPMIIGGMKGSYISQNTKQLMGTAVSLDFILLRMVTCWVCGWQSRGVHVGADRKLSHF